MSFAPVTPDLFADPAVSAVKPGPARPPFGLRGVGLLSILCGAAGMVAGGAAWLGCGVAAWRFYQGMNSTDSQSQVLMGALLGLVGGFFIVLLASYALVRAGVLACKGDPATIPAHRRSACGCFVGWGVILLSQGFAIRVLQLMVAQVLGHSFPGLPSPTMLVAGMAAAFLAYPAFVLVVPPLWPSKVQKNPFDVPCWRGTAG